MDTHLGRFRCALCLSVALVTLGSHVTRADPSHCDDLWSTADSLFDAEAYPQALVAYEAYMAECGVTQEAAVMAARCQIECDQAVEAANRLEAAIDMAPRTYWAAVGLYAQAKACSRAGCHDVARRAIAELKATFPEMTWTTRAEVVEAQLDGAQVSAAEQSLSREQGAFRLYREAVRLAGVKDYDASLAVLDRLITDYEDTRTVLAALHSQAKILARDRAGTPDGLAAFEDLLGELERRAPQSVMRFEVQRSVGALHQRMDQPDEARRVFQDLAKVMQDPELKAEATLQAIGAFNESNQRRYCVDEPVQPSDWAELRRRCARARANPAATPFQRARLDLIAVESLFWEGQMPEALAAAERLIAEYDASVDRRGVATARLMAGECLQALGAHEAALVHYDWIVDEFGDEEIWPGLLDRRHGRNVYAASLARTHYRIYDALRQGGGAPEDVSDAARVVLTRFPNTRYAELVAAALTREARR